MLNCCSFYNYFSKLYYLNNVSLKVLPEDLFTKSAVEPILFYHSQPLPIFDYEKLTEEEKHDGYCAIVTSELNMASKEIIGTYRDLWEIEETFRIAKGDLETRPIFLQREERINAHLLSCFISLVIIRMIIRILQKKTGRLYSVEKIVECLNHISCSREQDNLYLFDYRTEVSDAIGSAVGIDFTHKRLRLSDIKKYLAMRKNESLRYNYLTFYKGLYPSVSRNTADFCFVLLPKSGIANRKI